MRHLTISFIMFLIANQSELRQKLFVIEEKIKNIFQTQFESTSISFKFEELKIESFLNSSL